MLAVQLASLDGGSVSLSAQPGGAGFILLILPEGQSPAVVSDASHTAVWRGGDASVSLPMSRFSGTGLRGVIDMSNDPRLQSVKLLNTPSTLTVTRPGGETLFRLDLPQIGRDAFARQVACLREG